MQFTAQKRNKSFFIAFVIVLFIISSLNLAQKSVRGFFYFFSSPIQNTFFKKGRGLAEFFAFIGEKRDLISENDELNLKIQELTAENISLQSLKEENQLLRNVYGQGIEDNYRMALGKIISKDIGEDVVSINIGTKEGVLENMPVITQQKVLVGKVSQTFDDFSRVQLVSNKKSSLDVKIKDSPVVGLAKGLGQGKILLDLIPQDASITQDDIVSTSAMGGQYPEGLLIGQIGNIKKGDTKPYQQAEIFPYFDIQKTEDLFVMIAIK